MSFHLIDFQTWERKEFYEHFINEVVCTYSTTVNLDITNLKRMRLYPTIIWLLTKAVNQMPEFRTALTDKGVGIYDEMHPAYIIFNKENENFSAIWTEFHADYNEFLSAYETDVEKFSSSTHYAPKPDRPSNTFDISMVPWFTFTSFNINVFGEGKYLLPIFTLGKYFDDNGKRLLPISIQVHHAVCDGYHIGKFVETLQTMIDKFHA
ncbi:MAG: type A chloramphenicol O-acetyltransferase [Candidatus Pararuminococcus gallinarum]|jgi:chloramphenicol O-acetyltransferase type A